MQLSDSGGNLSDRGRKPVVLVAFALEEERVPVGRIAGMDVVTVVTGVGKVSAAMNLTRAVLEYAPALVINVGTAGTLTHEVGDILVCRHFVDRNLLGLKIHGVCAEISVEPSPLFTPESRVGGQWCADDFTANTGDNFVTAADDLYGDAIDMEAFACAAVCEKFGLPFLSVKYITDIVGCNSVKQWSDKLADARRELNAFLQTNCDNKL